MKQNKNMLERRKEIAEYLINFGPFGIPVGTKKEFAQKFNCTVRTIEKDIEYVISHTKIPKMVKLGQKFLLGYEKAMKVAAQMLQDESPDIRAKGIAAYNQTQDHYTKMCEKYVFKQVVAEKIEIEADVNYNALSKEERQAEIKRLLGK